MIGVNNNFNYRPIALLTQEERGEKAVRAANRGDAATLRSLLENNATISTTHRSEALELACVKGSEECIEILLHNRARVTQDSCDGALSYVTALNRVPCIRAIFTSAHISEEGWGEAMWVAAANNNVEALRTILTEHPNMPPENRVLAIHSAQKKNYKNCVKLLLENLWKAS